MADPKQIAVVTPAGDVRTIASTDAADAAEQGFELATPEQVKGAKTQAKFDEASALGKAGYVAGAAGAGALRGISAGLSDAALIHGAGLLGKDSATATRDTLNELRDVAPNASLLGEGAGMIGGLALGSGEVGFGGKALTAVSRAGGLAERGAARLLGEGASSLAGRVAQRGLATAASGAVEGALYGAGSTISEAALGDEQLTGEKLIAGATHGAVVGGALGGVLGGIGGAFSRRGGKLADVVAEREGAAASRVARDVGEGAEAGAASEGSWLNRKATGASRENVIKSTGGTLADVKKLRKYGDVDAAADNILKETEAFTGKDFARATQQDMVDTARHVLDESNATKKALLSSLDKEGVAVPSRQTIFQKFSDHVEPYISHLKEDGSIVWKAGAKEDLAPALKFAREMEASKATTFTDLFAESRALRKKTGFKAGSTDAKDVHLSALFDAIEGEMERAADAGAASQGAVFSQQWKAVKELQQHMIYLETAAQRGVDAGLKNNSFGLRAGIGAAMGVATGNPIGGLVTGLLGKAAKEQGDQIAASLWNKLAGLTKTQQAIARVDSQINSGVQKLMGSAVPKNALPKLPTFGEASARVQSAATYAAVSGTNRESYDKSANQIRSIAARPEALSNQVSDSLRDYSDHAPRATAAAAATAVRGVDFLASKLPPTTSDPNSLTPQLSKPNRMVSDIAIAKWMRYRDAVNDPVSVLTQARTGKITPEAVEAVKAVYPKLYEQLCDTVIRATVDAKRPISYQESIRIGILLDRPTDWSMTPKAQKAIQGTYLPPTPAPKSVSSGAQINISKDTMTSTERAAYR